LFFFQDEGVSLSATPGSSLDGGARPEVAADFQRDNHNGGDDGGETVSMESHNNRPAASQGPPNGRRKSPSLDEEEVGFPPKRPKQFSNVFLIMIKNYPKQVQISILMVTTEIQTRASKTVIYLNWDRFLFEFKLLQHINQNSFFLKAESTI
jgi:hypothetical protein